MDRLWPRSDRDQQLDVERVIRRSFVYPDSNTRKQISDRYVHPHVPTVLDSDLPVYWLETFRSSANRRRSSLRGRLYQAVSP
jgi:hypothetical protein